MQGALEVPGHFNELKDLKMFGMIKSLTKAVVGVVLETPVSIAADVVTLGGSLTDKKEPYTTTAIKKVVQNIEDSTKGEQE